MRGKRVTRNEKRKDRERERKKERGKERKKKGFRNEDEQEIYV